MSACFLTGPVAVSAAVRAAFAAAPVSHRDAGFTDLMRVTRTALCDLVNAPHVAVLLGSGTLANDAVAAQLAQQDEPGLILVNGEFGERLVDHARRWGLRFAVARQPWGAAIDLSQARELALRTRTAWIWAALTETSTGVANPLAPLLALSAETGADLCLDAVSAVGMRPVDFAGVRFASAVSGKGLAALPGLAAVFHDGRLASGARIPRYLDLGLYDAEGTPFTHSSNLLAAIACALRETDWRGKLERVARDTRWLHEELGRRSLSPLAAAADAAAGVVTIPIPEPASSVDVAAALRMRGVEVAWQSRYLLERNWLQVALMGEIDDGALRALPASLEACVRPRPEGRQLISDAAAAPVSCSPPAPGTWTPAPTPRPTWS